MGDYRHLCTYPTERFIPGHFVLTFDLGRGHDLLSVMQPVTMA